MRANKQSGSGPNDGPGEAGGRDWNPLIHIPAGFFKMLDHDT
jgi:hypothetical protein